MTQNQAGCKVAPFGVGNDNQSFRAETLPVSCDLCLSLHVSFQEILDGIRDLLDVCFECKVSGIVEVNLGVRIVTPESLCTRRQKEWIVLAPDRKQRRLLRSEILLELRVKRDIACVVQEKVELNLVIPGPSQQRRIESVGFRRD